MSGASSHTKRPSASYERSSGHTRASKIPLAAVSLVLKLVAATSALQSAAVVRSART